MTAERLTEEHLDRKQEMLNDIFNKFTSFPPTDIEVDPKNETDLGATLFSYHFPEGMTTPRYSDQLSGKHNFNSGELTIFYAKGINAGRITLVENSETNNVDLKSFVVLQKDTNLHGKTAYSINQSATKPHLHAIESLLAEMEARMLAEPELFKTNTEVEEQFKKQREMLKLFAVIIGRVTKQKAIDEKAKKIKNRRK